MKMQLSPTEIAKFKKPVRGRGGFQALLRRIQSKIDADGIVDLTEKDLEQLVRYSFKYGPGGFEERTKPTARRRTR